MTSHNPQNPYYDVSMYSDGDKVRVTRTGEMGTVKVIDHGDSKLLEVTIGGDVDYYYPN